MDGFLEFQEHGKGGGGGALNENKGTFKGNSKKFESSGVQVIES